VQVEHPCATQYATQSLNHLNHVFEHNKNHTTHCHLPLPPQPQQFHQNHCIVPANPYLTEEIPHWLYIYSKAPPELDHKLKVL